ncbi:MAG: demethoxyubiquinone hydroxylase family protein [Pseudomonadota bacterium]|nr:demethoxyubiquinone hydroxylase family protein [Pseudomonadota bacterium]
MTGKPLPGDFSHEERIARMIRVNHAGEYGAKRIYAGQLAVLGKSASAPVLKEMAEQEEKHLERFSELMVKRRVRPTALMPLWHIAGYALGAATALMGEKAAMACTVAVESVIDGHYAKQEEELGQGDEPLSRMVKEFRADEKEHHDTALACGAAQSPFYGALTAAISLQTKLAIWLSTRF